MNAIKTVSALVVVARAVAQPRAARSVRRAGSVERAPWLCAGRAAFRRLSLVRESGRPPHAYARRDRRSGRLEIAQLTEHERFAAGKASSGVGGLCG